jgi:ribosome-associated protein
MDAVETERTPLTEPAHLARHVVDLLADRQAEDIVLLDVRRVAPFADYFVIASANNPRQMRALVETLQRDLRDEGVHARHQEGTPDSGWVLIDYVDVIVHLFSPDLREFYALEQLWAAATQVVRIQ